MTEIGTTLRRAREAAGLSLSEMARRTNFGKSYLGNVETGTRRATAGIVLAYERALGEDVKRRGLLTGVAAAVVAPAAVTALLRRGFTAALNGRDAEEEWAERTGEYGRDYMSIGASDLQNRLAGDLVVIQQQLDSPKMWASAAKLLTVYGKTTQGAREASEWYRLAAVAADRSDETVTRVWVRGRAALALGYEGAGLITAKELAEQALVLSDEPSIGALNAQMALAHILALRGDRAGAIEWLEEGQRVFDLVGSSEQVSDFAVPEWRMATFTSMLLSRMGDSRAIVAQEQADRTRPASLTRFAAHIELHRGLMMAKAGDVSGGTAYARAALNALPSSRHSLTLRLMMAEINRIGRTDLDGNR
jgi:transcriptional regulator with XRE-family HTH domain